MPEDANVRAAVTELQISDARDNLLLMQALATATENAASQKALHRRVDTVEKSLMEMPTKQDIKEIIEASNNESVAVVAKKILYTGAAIVGTSTVAAVIKYGGIV